MKAKTRPARSFRVGLIADTHGLYDEQLDRLFARASLILHAGDIGQGVLERLEQLAPVRAVVGNNDAGVELPAARVEMAHGVRILVVHELGSVDEPKPSVQFLLQAEAPNVVVSGHSHHGRLDERDGVLFLNPGGAGKKRFKLVRSAALLDISRTSITATLYSLEQTPPAKLSQLRVRR